MWRVVSIGLVLWGAGFGCSSEGDADASGRQPVAYHYDLGPAKSLRVLYAGVPDTARGEAFLELLSAAFDQVDAVHLRSLNVPASAPYDVVVADWDRRWNSEGPRSDYEWPNIFVEPEFTKPVVMLASGGLSIQHHTKLWNW